MGIYQKHFPILLYLFGFNGYARFSMKYPILPPLETVMSNMTSLNDLLGANPSNRSESRYVTLGQAALSVTPARRTIGGNTEILPYAWVHVVHSENFLEAAIQEVLGALKPATGKKALEAITPEVVTKIVNLATAKAISQQDVLKLTGIPLVLNKYKGLCLCSTDRFYRNVISNVPGIKEDMQKAREALSGPTQVQNAPSVEATELSF